MSDEIFVRILTDLPQIILGKITVASFIVVIPQGIVAARQLGWINNVVEKSVDNNVMEFPDTKERVLLTLDPDKTGMEVTVERDLWKFERKFRKLLYKYYCNKNPRVYIMYPSIMLTKARTLRLYYIVSMLFIILVSI